MTPPEPAEPGTDPFDCPRCGTTVNERFWGPCTACRAQLVAAHSRAGSEDTDAGSTAPRRFEPSMHVVPNHVATKD